MSSSSVETVTIRSLAEALDLVRRDEEDRSSCPRWYRGHACESSSLIPSAFRKSDDVAREIDTYARFRLRAPALDGACPPQDDLAGWMMFMQHAGLPTRMLDWTDSLATAAFFASEGAREGGDACIWELHPCELNEVFVGEHELKTTEWAWYRESLEALWKKDDRSDGGYPAVALLPHQAPGRLFAQGSCFTFHLDRGALDEVAPAGVLRRLRIPASAMKRVRADLAALGVRRSTLFPDPDNLAREIAADDDS